MFFFALFHLFIQAFRLHAESVRDLRQSVELATANGIVLVARWTVLTDMFVSAATSRIVFFFLFINSLTLLMNI